MSILNRLEEAEYSTVRRPYPWSAPVAFSISDAETGKELVPNGLSVQREYMQTFSARVTYWANDVERPRARSYAHQALVRTIYGDILAKLHYLKLAVVTGSREEAVTLLDDITKTVEGP